MSFKDLDDLGRIIGTLMGVFLGVAAMSLFGIPVETGFFMYGIFLMVGGTICYVGKLDIL